MSEGSFVWVCVCVYVVDAPLCADIRAVISNAKQYNI